jgi:hypothetical protein
MCFHSAQSLDVGAIHIDISYTRDRYCDPMPSVRWIPRCGEDRTHRSCHLTAHLHMKGLELLLIE